MRSKMRYMDPTEPDRARHIEPVSADIVDRLADLCAVHLLHRAGDHQAVVVGMKGGALTLERYREYLKCGNPSRRNLYSHDIQGDSQATLVG